ncbi:MAG TPA: endonuclease/exonuclease/phosphatase family protein [Polyangiaceae bacterium]|nr:endonuclease/exonuclease/phosphatase family protein [Polyangiaceae bacterium]
MLFRRRGLSGRSRPGPGAALAALFARFVLLLLGGRPAAFAPPGGRRPRWPLALVLVAALPFADGLCPPRSPLRVATFNIENYPKSSRQEAGAFEAIRGVEASAIGVQEIVEPEAFAEAARRRLGPAWRFVHAEGGPKQRVGVLFDGGALELVSTHTYRETEAVYPGAKPTFEARLRPKPSVSFFGAGAGEVLRLMVVHLKAQGDGVDLRRAQLKALRPVFAAAMGSGERVVLLGDFNATDDSDRDELAALAAATGATWASRELPCTSYWARPDGCRGSALDHVFTWAEPRRIAAEGPCESEGCSPGSRCPIFREEVSDHCPVAVDLR